MIRSEYISREEAERREKKRERRVLFWTFIPMVISLIAWVTSNIIQIQWLQIVSISFIIVYLLFFLFGLSYGLIKLSDRSV